MCIHSDKSGWYQRKENNGWRIVPSRVSQLSDTHLCLQYPICVCSTPSVSAVPHLCLQYLICVCSTSSVFAVPHLCLQYPICVGSTLSVSAVPYLCLQYPIYVCANYFCSCLFAVTTTKFRWSPIKELQIFIILR